MTHPNGPLLRVLAARVLSNLDFIDRATQETTTETHDRSSQPFTDTQLLISTLGFLVFPHERAPDALGKLLKDFDKTFSLADVMTVVHPKGDHQSIEIADEDGSPVFVDYGAIDSLPRLLRNSIAHFNVRPLKTESERFGGIRVWNMSPAGEITFIADICFDELRTLARFLLSKLANGGEAKDIDDPADPIELLQKQQERCATSRMPKLNRDHWQAALKINGGDPRKAKTWIDRTLSAGLQAVTDGNGPPP
jgi:hypothetical protein